MKNKFKLTLIGSILCLSLTGCSGISINTQIFGSGVNEGAEGIEESITEDHRTLREKWQDFIENIKIDIPTSDEKKHEKQEEVADKLLSWYSGKDSGQSYSGNSYKVD